MLNRKHLTFEERCFIEKELHFRHSLASIAKALGRSKSTISREIKRHDWLITISSTKKSLNPCAIQKHCVQKALCPLDACMRQHQGFCKSCQHCVVNCPYFIKAQCHRLKKAPYVCNGCPERRGCLYPKHQYAALAAQRAYAQQLSQQRQGISLSANELRWLSESVLQGLKRGLSPHVIYQQHKDDMPCSERSLYRYVNQGLLEAKRLDLPMAVRYRPRRNKKQHKVDPACRQGRTYQDFLKYREQHRDLSLVQMDSVIGLRGGKVLLTFHFENCGLLLPLLRVRNTAQSVIEIFDQLTDLLGLERFRTLFPLILTDNGCEFSNPSRLEYTLDGKRRTRLFYCNPGRPDQKGAIENAHLLLRKVLPKGSSFEHLTREALEQVASHINSYTRKKLNDKSPNDLFSFFHGERTLQRLGLRPIPSEEICLSTRLLGKEGADHEQL